MKKLNDLKDASEIQFKRNFSIEKIFFGDSLVEQLIEGKIFPKNDPVIKLVPKMKPKGKLIVSLIKKLTLLLLELF